MNLLRAWNTYVPTHIRRNEFIPVILFVLAILTFVWLGHMYRYNWRPNTFCESEINYRLLTLNKSRIHMLPPTAPRVATGEVLHAADDIYNNECVEVFGPQKNGPLLICIHDPRRDLMVSAHLKEEGAWEPENIEALYQAHQMFPQMVLVDLGCNVGVFTLPAAQMGMEVIGVDSMMLSLKLLQRSLFINGLSCRVTLINNALYSKRVPMRVAVDPSNVGGSTVMEILENRKDQIKPSQIVDAICLDDLLPFVQGKDIFLKIDLEGKEEAVLKCAHEFFKNVNIKVLLIEWMYYRHNEEASKFIKEFLVSHGLKPTWGVDSDRHIDLYASHSWPDNVFWMKA
ncbi:uncharacterized protein LOC131932936 [Physella acuta]|uniref:uncharacterized protein LOC131932936 n=1 Tax=Physella acuta TaxID=109671 RepID=UPI0027DB5AD2|nr:uncharacterized protein LOC131932936 [Physella acuta]XP_059145813.1 uncharacterized protein LOC131932936 [Physella acuta]